MAGTSTSFPFPPRAARRPVPPGGAVVPPPARRGPALSPEPFSPRAQRGGARPLANRRERGGCSTLRSEDGPRDRTARSASAGYVGNTRCPRARSSLISVLLLSPLGRAEERRVLGVGGSVRATGSQNCEAGRQSQRGGCRAVRSGLNFTLRDVGSPVPTPSCLPAGRRAGLLQSRLSAGCPIATPG